MEELIRTLADEIVGFMNGEDNLGKWDKQFWYKRTQIGTLMVKKEFNCLVCWWSYVGPTSFNDGDEDVQRMYHPLCILDKNHDVYQDLVNALVREEVIRLN